MVTELQKLFCLRLLIIEKLHKHEVYSSSDYLPFYLKEFYINQIRIERSILCDINKRLEVLNCES